WDYLIHVSEEEVLSLPLSPKAIHDLSLPKEARNLISFWVAKGRATPAKNPSAWANSGLYTRGCHLWGAGVRERIASQVCAIRHWTIKEGDYMRAPDAYATWFVDPPYEKAGVAYRSSQMDF